MQTSRKWEKRIAWFSNIIMLIIAALASLIAFTGMINSLGNIPIIGNAIDVAITQGVYQDPMWAIFLGGTGINSDSVVGVVSLLAKIVAVILIIVVILAFIATVSMRSRIFAGTLFILVALINIFGAWFMSIPYAIVALLLFARK
ncbi:MAG: hypothetical protein Q3988_05255 [Gemella sp.]|nr:hypothetical protein [Gemella sp.]